MKGEYTYPEWSLLCKKKDAGLQTYKNTPIENTANINNVSPLDTLLQQAFIEFDFLCPFLRLCLSTSSLLTVSTQLFHSASSSPSAQHSVFSLSSETFKPTESLRRSVGA